MKRFILLLTVLFVFLSSLPVCAVSDPGLSHSAASLVYCTEPDRVLYSSEADKKVYPAALFDRYMEREPLTPAEKAMIAPDRSDVADVWRYLRAHVPSGRTLYCDLMELCLGNTSDFYNRMYESGLLNDSFSVSVFCGRGYFSVIAEGESVDPDKVLSEMVKELGRLKADGLDEEEFITIRNKTYGELVAGLNNVESVANSMLSQEINGVGIYDGIEITANTTFEDVKAALANMDIENNSLSIIEPV